MKLSSIVITLASFALVGGDAVPSSSSLGTVAIARTFSVKDAMNLSASFDAWKEFPPCDGDPSYIADLVLVFSGSLRNSTCAMTAMQEVASRFEATNGFGNCFDKLLGLGCDIDPSKDIYQPMEASSNSLWVNGPNRQFTRTVRAMKANKYSYFGLMEMDSVPVRAFWLDALVEEIENQSNDFAIMGSTYRGYKWDSFYSELPTSLRRHINGNAVYNPRHPVLERLVTTLEDEAGTAGNTVAYDYRMAQIIYESKTGKQAEFPHAGTLDLPPTYSKLFVDMDVKWPEVIRETSLIANFAGTNVVPQYLGDDTVIAHGAQMFEKWNSSLMGNISLIVSDWSPSNVQVLLESLEKSSHPFAEIVVMVPDRTRVAAPSVIGGTMVRMIPRHLDLDSMDVCTAPVSTRWAMKTNSYFQIREAVPLLVHEGKPVVTFSVPTKESCFDYKTCVEDLKHAKLISAEANRVFDDLDMVYDVDMRDKYCSHVLASSHGSPSATEYVSYVELVEPNEPMYFFSDREKGGLLSPFLRLSDLQVPEELKRAYHRRLQDSTNFTGSSAGSDSTCTGSGTESECSSIGCRWNYDLKTCRSNPNLLTEEQSAPTAPDRPKLFTALIIVAIAGASVAVLGLMYVGYKKVSQGASGVAVSVQPVDGSRDPERHHDGDDDEVDSSLLLGSEFGFSKISGASFEEMDLNDGRFEERSGGVEYIQD